MSEIGSRASRVLIWRWGWLAPSETFIRSQFDAYEHWVPCAVGADYIESANSRKSDHVLYGRSTLDRVFRLLFKIWDWSPRLARLMTELDPDLIHAHFGGDASRVRRVAKRLGKPFVVTLHGSDVTARPNRPGLRGLRNRARLEKVIRDADLLVAVSEHIAAAARRQGADPKKLVVIPIGVPWTDKVEDKPRKGVLFVGRFVDKKGLPDLIEAYSRLSPALRNEHPLRLIGDGPLRAEILRLAAQTGVEVRMLGALPPAEVSRYLAAAAVFAVPSHVAADGDTEGLPTVVFEAARAGTPVVGYTHAGIPEAVEHGVSGLLAPERDVPRLAGYMEQLLEDAVLAGKMGDAARARYEAEFEVGACTRVLEQHYDRILKSVAAQE